LLNTWNNENISTYKALLKAELKKNKFTLSKEIIQQITDSEELKSVMYQFITEIDNIQEQFSTAAHMIENQKVTLFYIGDFGSISEQQVTVTEIKNTRYAQHDKTVKLTYTPKGKRKQYYQYFYSDILVYTGFHELPKTVLYDVTENNNYTLSHSKYLSCDKKQYDEILKHFNALGIKPVVNTYNNDYLVTEKEIETKEQKQIESIAV
jgi:hypothetical protein